MSGTLVARLTEWLRRLAHDRELCGDLREALAALTAQAQEIGRLKEHLRVRHQCDFGEPLPDYFDESATPAGEGPQDWQHALAAMTAERDRLRDAVSDLKATRNSRERDIEALELERDRLLRTTRVDGPHGTFYTLSREQIEALASTPQGETR